MYFSLQRRTYGSKLASNLDHLTPFGGEGVRGERV